MAQSLNVLTLNSGSSSLKVALFELGAVERERFSGGLTQIGEDHGTFVINVAEDTIIRQQLPLPDHGTALQVFARHTHRMIAEERGDRQAA